MSGYSPSLSGRKRSDSGVAEKGIRLQGRGQVRPEYGCRRTTREGVLGNQAIRLSG